jgi:hypothetical protein
MWNHYERVIRNRSAFLSALFVDLLKAGINKMRIIIPAMPSMKTVNGALVR